MDSTLHFNRTKWKKRPNPPNCKTPLLTFFILLFCIVFFISSKSLFSTSTLQISTNSKSDIPLQCTTTIGAGVSSENFLWYAPHSGFSNQLSEFKNAILMAAILNRTLIVPPVLDHHAVALGSCPKFRVLNANDLRFKVWNHSIELIIDRRYTSMADIIDLSSLISISAVKFIDFRVFVSMWCGVNINLVCSKDLSKHSSLHESLRQCGSLLSGLNGNVKNCLFASEEDCRMTVWTYQKDGEDGILDSFQPDDELKTKKKITFVRKRRDVHRTFGPGSEAGSASVLAFGSLFTAPYKGSESHIDIHEAPQDQRIQSLIQKIEFIPFVPEIINCGKMFALQTIKAPFLCAQLRLLDGQFKNHWRATFRALKEKLDFLKEKGPLPIHVFVMTDLPMRNWTGTYLGDLEKDSDAFKLFILREGDKLVMDTAKKLVSGGRNAKFQPAVNSLDGGEKHCNPQSLSDILLFVEETVCSCARLGLVGTAGSTIAESIELMRKNSICLP
ncbi:O-fucosyltransferase family protein [Abeliophyllum distichum]|uniref:O-fucosyltransferase family protein n=1 Tax=Abeliophyllum distichum TaxID=126358 RepID=A0ABD1TZJ7_9LAMI